MIVKSIYLENFRNYKAQEIKLEDSINVFYGNNAQGKTNILEALYFCAFGRSFRTHKDAELICFNNDNAKIVVEFNKAERDKIISSKSSEDKWIIDGNYNKTLKERFNKADLKCLNDDDGAITNLPDNIKVCS